MSDTSHDIQDQNLNKGADNTASNRFATRRTLWIVVILLTLVNVLTLSYTWMWMHGCQNGCLTRFDERPKQPQHGFGAFEFIRREVGMNDTQEQKYLSLREQHQADVRPLRDSMRVLRRELFTHMQVSDEGQLNERLRQLAAVQVSIDSITVRHFQLVRALLQKEQQEKFDSIIVEATHMMSAGPLPGRGHGQPPREHDRDREQGPLHPPGHDDDMHPPH